MKVKYIGMTYVKCTKLLSVEKSFIDYEGIPDDRGFLIIDGNGMPVSSSQHSKFMSLSFFYDNVSNFLTMVKENGEKIVRECVLDNKILTIEFDGIKKFHARRVSGDWSKILYEISGKPHHLVKNINHGSGVDVLPITLFTTGSLSYLESVSGQSVDYRRFRANLVIDNPTPFIEDGWEGKTLRVGSVLLKVLSPVPRCIVTQLDPDTGKNNMRTVAHLMSFRQKVKLPDGILPDYAMPGFSSFATVITPGEVTVGDMVTIF